ncbi:MAG: PAS domain S-box protein, partial [Actinomycetes bacterium]
MRAQQGPHPQAPTASNLGAFFEAAPVLTCLATPDGFLPQIGGPWTDTLGWPAEALTTRPFFDFVHPDDLAATAAALDRLNSGETVVAFTNRYRTADGGWKFLRWYAQPIEDGNVYAIATDVTDEATHELQLAEQNYLLETMADFHQSVMTATQMEQSFTHLRDRLTELTGGAEVMIGAVADRPGFGPVIAALTATQSFAAVLEPVVESDDIGDLPSAPIGLISDLNTLTGAAVRTVEPVVAAEADRDVRRSPIAGRDAAVSNQITLPLPGRNGVVGVIAIADLPDAADPDIVKLLTPLCLAVGTAIEHASVQRRNEHLIERTSELSALLTAVTEDIDTLLVVTDTNGLITFMNSAAETVLGVSTESAAGRLTPAAFVGVPTDDPEAGRQDYVDAYTAWSADPGRSRAEWTFTSVGGQRVPLLVSVTPLRSDAGSHAGWVHLGTSLADRYAVEAARTNAAVMATEIDALRSRERELGLLAEA